MIEKPVKMIKIENKKDIPKSLKSIPFEQLKGLTLPLYQTNFIGLK